MGIDTIGLLSDACEVKRAFWVGESREFSLNANYVFIIESSPCGP
jgi:hypothetical protein